MKKLLILILSIISFASIAQTNDASLKSESNTNIRLSTASQNKTATVIDHVIENKVNLVGGVVATGTNTYAATVSTLTAYSTGLAVDVNFTNGNSGASTLNLNSIGATSIRKNVSGTLTALSSGDISAGQPLRLFYDGTYFVIEGATSSGGGSGVTSFNGRTGVVVPTSSDYVKGDVGLGNVDNTSDASKPVSTLQAAADALNLKIASNLSDLNNAGTARTNLGLGSAALISSTAGGDLSGTLPSPTVTKINGTSLATLATGLIKNTTTTGVPSIATGADLPTMTATVGGAVPTPPNNTTTFLRGDGTFAAPGAGTVNSGTSGQIAYYASTGAAVSGTTTGTGILTALGINTGSAGSPVLFNGAGGTPASINLANGTFPTLNQNTTGSAATLTTPRNIQGVSFNGSANIDVLNGTGFVKATGTTISYDAGTAGSSLTGVDGANIDITVTGSNLLVNAGSITAELIGLVPTNRGGTGADNTMQTYTPTLTNSANISASTARSCQYSRNGNVVIVSGQLDIDPTITATLTTLGISLPIASALTTAYQCGGTAAAISVTDAAAGIQADATNDRATLQYMCADVTNHTLTFTFTYQVL